MSSVGIWTVTLALGYTLFLILGSRALAGRADGAADFFVGGITAFTFPMWAVTTAIAFASALHVVTGLPVHLTVVFTALLLLAYLAAGGMRSVAFTLMLGVGAVAVLGTPGLPALAAASHQRPDVPPVQRRNRAHRRVVRHLHRQRAARAGGVSDVAIVPHARRWPAGADRGRVARGSVHRDRHPHRNRGGPDAAGRLQRSHRRHPIRRVCGARSPGSIVLPRDLGVRARLGWTVPILRRNEPWARHRTRDSPRCEPRAARYVDTAIACRAHRRDDRLCVCAYERIGLVERARVDVAQ